MDLGNPQSLNRYAYFGNNPLGFIDPSGLLTNGAYCGSDCGGAGGLVGIFVQLGKAFCDLFCWSKFSFHGSLQARPNSPATLGDNGVYTMQVYWNIPQYIPLILASINSFSPLLLAGLTPNNTVSQLPTPTKVKATIPGTNYCGPGGGGTPTTRVDKACAAHDLCYQNAGISFVNNVFGTGVLKSRRRLMTVMLNFAGA